MKFLNINLQLIAFLKVPTQTGWIDSEFQKLVVSEIPMKKLIEPSDIAQTILFLASEQAKMITGQVIKVSGGHYI